MGNWSSFKLYSPEVVSENGIAYIYKVIYYFTAFSCRICLRKDNILCHLLAIAYCILALLH
jgi:hypothetical protein